MGQREAVCQMVNCNLDNYVLYGNFTRKLFIKAVPLFNSVTIKLVNYLATATSC